MKTAMALAAIAGIALVAGCSGEAVDPPTDDELEQMISEAASIRNDVFDRLTLVEGGMLSVSIADMKDQTLTQALMFMPFMRESPDGEKAGARKAELEILVGQGLGRAAALADVLSRRRSGPGGSGRANYASLIHPEYVTDLTRNVEGDTMVGAVSFEAKDVYRGRIQYTARRGRDGWRVVDLCMPIRGLRTTLGEDGLWQAWVRPGADGPFAVDEEVEINLPAIEEDRKVGPKSKLIVIHIREGGSYVVDGKPLTRAALQAMLAEAVKVDSGQKIIIRADPNAGYKHMADCASLCKEAGIGEVNLGIDLAIPASMPSGP